jgi:hypothetical protein
MVPPYEITTAVPKIRTWSILAYVHARRVRDGERTSTASSAKQRAQGN